MIQETQIRTKLLADADVRAAFGERIRPVVLDRGDVLPGITWRRVAGPPEDYIAVELTTWALSYLEAWRLAAIVKTAMASSDVNFIRSRLSDQVDADPALVAPGAEQYAFGVSQTYAVWTD